MTALKLLTIGVLIGNIDRLPDGEPFDALRAYLFAVALIVWAILWMAIFEAVGLQGIWT